jgi:hypothetical protein
MVAEDVEEIVEPAARAVLKDVHQHPIGAGVGHVIGDNVLQPSHLVSLHLGHKSLEVFLCAQLGIQLIGVGDIVPVGATRRGLENGEA